MTSRVAWLHTVPAMDIGVAAKECRGVDLWIGDDATTGFSLEGQG